MKNNAIKALVVTDKLANLIITDDPVGIVVTRKDRPCYILEANDMFFDTFGFNRQEFDKKFSNCICNMLSKEDADNFLSAVKTDCESVLLNMRTRGGVILKVRVIISAYHDGEKHMLCMKFKVVSNSKYDHSLPFNEREFYHLVESLSDDAFFDYDMPSAKLTLSEHFAHKFGLDSVTDNFPQIFFDKGIILQEKFEAMVSKHRGQGHSFRQEETMLSAPDGRKYWYSISTRAITNEKGDVLRVVGRMNDVTRHHMAIESLTEQSQKDVLTGLYNKGATEELIKQRLAADNVLTHALLIVDIDNFKLINDTFGHLYGDVVLTQLAEGLQAIFRTGDIIGRVGGDEFFVLIESYKDLEVITRRAQEICTAFKKKYVQQSGTVEISASIGIALFPKHGQDFQTIYKSADLALYKSKADGKNRFTIFEGEVPVHYRSNRTAFDVGNMPQKNFKENRIEFIFKLLYGFSDPIDSIEAVLKLVTEHFGFSRGYIFECESDRSIINNTFEVCVDDVVAQKQNLQGLSSQKLTTAFEAFEKYGMFLMSSLNEVSEYERKLLEPQGIKSMFQFGILDQGEYVGLVGFDSCSVEKVPDQYEIHDLCTICNVISEFLTKHRRYAEIECNYKALDTIIEHLGGYTYVINAATFEILYENHSVQQITAQKNIGKKCYSAIMGNTSQCADCAIHGLCGGKTSYTRIIDNINLGLTVKTTCKSIKWPDGRDAYLISSIES